MRRFLAVSCLVLALPFAGSACADEMAAPVSGPRAAIAMAMIDARDKILDLARAMPEAKYAWRPGKGVRSVGEVYRHVAQANYLLPTLMGIKVPEGVTLKDLDTTPLDKAQTIALVERSFTHALSVIAQTPDAALEDTVQIFGNPGTKMTVLMGMATHAHEHLGQSIAYARTNAVVPPWTAKQEAEQAARAKAKGK
jgi:uncharacterized damage-inducible protein DinB